MAEVGSIEIEVVYALPQRQSVVTLTVPAGTTVEQAVARSGILGACPEIDRGNLQVGIYGERVALKRVLREQDRIEIYRPLIADPKQVRRKRALGALKNKR